jgi:hypothetical protein
MTVYLLHFCRKYHHAGHYIGFVEDGEAKLKARLERHRCGDGARLLEVIVGAGIDFECVRTWEGADRHFERKLKKRKKAPQLCPVCRKQQELKNACFKLKRKRRRKVA